MQQPSPFFREAGAGSSVVCVHSNASNSGQWRDLMNLLAPKFHVVAANSYGAGKSADWPSDRVTSLDNEVDFPEPVLTRVQASLVLVGHSYGGAVALIAVLRRPERVRALVLYEPTLFALIEEAGAAPNDADGVKVAVLATAAALDAGDPDAAAGHFIDYWMGTSGWANTPAAHKTAIAASIVNVRRWGHALLCEPTPLAAFRVLDMPVLCMTGRKSTVAAHGVVHLLAGVLPQVTVKTFDKLGHMAPITDAAVVNQAIADFLDSL